MHIDSNNSVELRKRVQAAILSFESAPFKQAAITLLNALGYASDKDADFGNSPNEFLARLEEFGQGENSFNRTRAKVEEWKSCSFLFQLTNDEIPTLAFSPGQALVGAGNVIIHSQIESFVFLAIDLNGEVWSRSDLASITREINRRFPMPAIIIFHHGALLSLAVIDRRPNLKDPSRDVVGSRRITVIKDVSTTAPHRAHLEILCSLALENLGGRQRPSNFSELYKAWIEVLSTQALNKRFYTELSWWYFWAVKQVEFPMGGGKDTVKRHSVAVIRLLTRLIFVWFIKEKGLIPEDFFDRNALKLLLKSDPSDDLEASNYYQAVLQNLFFATLNVEMGTDRKWAADGSGMKSDRLVHSLYRHKELFAKPQSAIDLFSKIPYLNGGLFECLDRELTARDLERNPELKELASKEGNGWVLRIDGFTRRTEAQPKVPNKIFFNGESDVDLSAELGKSQKLRNVDGLIDLFERYKFTVDENTPLEEEVALDPELLGRVFENLLASYNEDTRDNARKKSGSFYTPREVVDFMVDEALVAALEHHLHAQEKTKSITASSLDNDTEDLEPAADRLRSLLTYGTEIPEFTQQEKTQLISAIESLKVLDPACGSGAFPMGVLAKLVHLLKKLDPQNELWRQQNRKPLEEQLATAQRIPDPSLREDKVLDAEDALRKLDRDFSNASHADYTRKLYLIEKCIHGVDIQPIAVQIAKLRFFISLIVSQDVDPSKENWGITALPNLETKIVAADSLTPIERPTQLALRNPAISLKEQELVLASEGHFAARSFKTKRKWRDRIFELRDELAKLLEEDRYFASETAKLMVHWNPFDQNASAEFFDPEWMFQIKDGFDVVIGNPPYVRQEKIEIPPKSFLKEHYDCYSGTADLYVYFYERSVLLLKPGGAFAFITSNKWYRVKYGEGLRFWMNQNTNLRSVIDFGDAPVFDAIAYPTIVIATRRTKDQSALNAENTFKVMNWKLGSPMESFARLFVSENFKVEQVSLDKANWQLEPPNKRDLLSAICDAGRPLGQYVNGRLYRGILTGLNDAFVIDSERRSELIASDPSCERIIRPFLRGRDIKRWNVEFADQYLIKIESSENVKHSWSGQPEKNAEREFSRLYPAIYKRFKSLREELIDRFDQGTYFWELRSCAYWDEFEQPKICIPAIAESPQFAYDARKHYCNNKTTIVVAEDVKYVLGVMNSSVIAWMSTQVCASKQGGFYDYEPRYSSQLIVPNASDRQKKILSIIVDLQLTATSTKLEQLVNGLSYELFFPEAIHRAGIKLFDALDDIGVQNYEALKAVALQEAAADLVGKISSTAHPIFAMLFNLQSIDEVRLIEGKE